MNALETLLNIAETNLYLADLKYCVVSKDKMPLKIDGSPCKPNVDTDFVDLEDLVNISLETYAGIGISIRASQVCAIDVDHCFAIPFSLQSADKRANYFIDKFKDIAYIEFSFSGTGLRILFKTDNIEYYSDEYYTKNSMHNIEFYQPSGSARYVTITGRTIYNNEVKNIDINIVKDFLNTYMRKPTIKINVNFEQIEEKRSLEELLIETKRLYLKNSRFQELWFKKAPGSGKNESELDYQLLVLIYENITQDKEKLRLIFETSEYFKSKDYHHMSKWNYDNHRYFNYQYDNIRRSH